MRVNYPLLSVKSLVEDIFIIGEEKMPIADYYSRSKLYSNLERELIETLKQTVNSRVLKEFEPENIEHYHLSKEGFETVYIMYEKEFHRITFTGALNGVFKFPSKECLTSSIMSIRKFMSYSCSPAEEIWHCAKAESYMYQTLMEFGEYTFERNVGGAGLISWKDLNPAQMENLINKQLKNIGSPDEFEMIPTIDRLMACCGSLELYLRFASSQLAGDLLQWMPDSVKKWKKESAGMVYTEDAYFMHSIFTRWQGEHLLPF